ncbi:hypothetical protein Ddc_19773 [Ditylenchus destructor]|nr:hypothetical protein Ddc_19773 [Ditylenchus destructor]
MDNGTMVEVFKYMNYCQLAKNSLTSKRFRDLIQTHRHSFALLCVDYIHMRRIDNTHPLYIKMFDKELSAKAYSEWIRHNRYPKHIPFEIQIAAKKSSRKLKLHHLSAWRTSANKVNTVFNARADLDHQNWPLFQHFVRLLTDPFVYFRRLNLTPHNELLTFLAGAINRDPGRIQCETLFYSLDDNIQKFITWTKSNVLCDTFNIHCSRPMPLSDEELLEVMLDFFLSGACCTSKIGIVYPEPSKVIFAFVQKFLDLKSYDECQVVKSIKCNVGIGSVDILKLSYDAFIVHEENDEDDNSSEHVFEFVNDEIGKKLQLTAKIQHRDRCRFKSYFMLEIQS